MEAPHHGPGETIIAGGERQDDRVFFIVEGEVSVALALDDGSHQRVATLSRGMSFGEMAFVGAAVRSASVFADGPVQIWTLSAGALDRLAGDHPAIMIGVLRRLSSDLAQNCARRTR